MKNTREREALYDRCRGANRFPVCNLCHLEVTPGQDWDESHLPIPKWLNGVETGIAHRRCNQHHNNTVVTPMAAKCKRVRTKHIGARLPTRPLPCGRASGRSKSFRYGIVPRLTLGQKLAQLGLVEQ